MFVQSVALRLFVPMYATACGTDANRVEREQAADFLRQFAVDVEHVSLPIRTFMTALASCTPMLQLSHLYTGAMMPNKSRDCVKTRIQSF